MLRRAAIALTAALVVAPAASAALTVTLSIAPTHPRAGAAVMLTVRPFVPRQRPDGSCCRLEPARADRALVLQALGPRGARFDFRPSRSRDRARWFARLRFPRSGRWELRVADFYASARDAARAVRYPPAAPRLAVDVRRAAGTPAVSTGTTCSAGEVRALVLSFVRAFNSGDLRRLDAIFRPAYFRWYSSGPPGVRLRAEAYRRATLLAYFAERHAQRDRLRLLDLDFNGNGGGHAHFGLRLRRSADDHRHATPFTVVGKGAVACTTRPRPIAVWSLGGPEPS